MTADLVTLRPLFAATPDDDQRFKELTAAITAYGDASYHLASGVDRDTNEPLTIKSAVDRVIDSEKRVHQAITALRPGVEQLADETRLDRYLAALTRVDADLCDVSNVLHVLGRTPVDPVRLQRICEQLTRVLGEYNAHVRHAPPAALNDLVAEVLVGCRNDTCAEKVAPWETDYDGACGPTCENERLRTVES